MKKLKIAIFEPTRVVPGGGQKVMPAIASSLSKKHDVTVFAQAKKQGEEGYGASKIKLVTPKNPYLAPFAFLKKNFIDLSKFDIKIIGCFPATLSNLKDPKIPSLHITNSPPRDFYGLKKHRLKNANLIGKLKIHIKYIFFKKLDYIAAQKYTKILGVSEEIKRRIKRDYKRDSKILYSGIDPKKYKEGKYENYILSVTRMVSPKRPKLIAQAMNHVKNKKVKMIFVGGGPENEEVKKIVKGNPQVEVKGFVSEKELKDLYANCLAAIYVPINEDYGYAPVEAGVCAKATIGVNEGGLKETIIDKKTGYLINKVTPKKIAEKIDLLANNKKLAIKMGKAAKEHCKQFHWKKILKTLDQSIEETINTKK